MGSKVKSVLETEKCKKLQDKIGGYSKEVSKNLGKAQKEFLALREENKKKNDQVHELYHHVLTKLIDPKEMEEFKKNMSNMVVMVVPDGMSNDNFQFIDN